MGNMVGSFRRPVVPTGTGRLMHKFCIIGPDNLFRQAQVGLLVVGHGIIVRWLDMLLMTTSIGHGLSTIAMALVG